MYTYATPLVRSYSLGSQDFTSPYAGSIPVPAWAKACRVEGISVAASVTFTNDTTAGFVRVGPAADDDKFAELDMATTAATDSLDGGPYPSDYFIDLERDGDAGAALTQLEVVTVAPTGGVPAGTGLVDITISWW